MYCQLALQAHSWYNMSNKTLCFEDVEASSKHLIHLDWRRILDTVSPLKNYSNTTNLSGIYQITCTANGKIYIGSAANLHRRQRIHYCELQQNKHYNPHLQNA